MTCLIFFGAGASKPFGIPTMQDMVMEFEEELKDSNQKSFEFYSEIKNKLIEEYGESKIDIEIMLSVINGIAMNLKPSELGHFIFYYASINDFSKEFSLNMVDNAKKVRDLMHDYITKTCKGTMQENIDNAYKKSYVPFFRCISGTKTKYGNLELALDWKAYTTNYDNIFEDFWRDIQPPIDHFKNTDGLAKVSFKTEQLPDEHTFSKLHGSLDWTKEVDTGDLIRKSSTSFNLSPTKGQIALFPIQQKDLYLQPWFTLLQDLGLGLSKKDTWYVIGYAFNDVFIKDIFEESLKSRNARLIIVNPEAKEIKEKFSDQIRDKIDVLPIKFGSESFALEFKAFTTKVIRLNVRITCDENLDLMQNEIIIQSSLDMIKIHPFSDNITSFNITQKSEIATINIENLAYTDVEFQLQINYNYEDEIKLEFTSAIYGSPDTSELYFTISYKEKVIYDYTRADRVLVVPEERPRLHYTIKLDKNTLFANE